MERRSYISLQLLPERKAIMLATGNSEKSDSEGWGAIRRRVRALKRTLLN